MKKFDKLYNLIMEDINPIKIQAWDKKLKQYPQFSAAWDNEEMWDKYVNRWNQWYWQKTPEEIEALTDDQILNLWEEFMKNAHNYVDFWLGEINASPQRHKELYWKVRHSMTESILTESCFDDGTYDELYDWYDQDLVSAVLDMLSHNDLFYPPRTVARLLEDKDILEVYNEGRLRDLTENYINWKINPRYYSSYGLKKFKDNK